MLDGVLLERRGIPAAAICTEPFVPNATEIGKAHGAPDYPFVLIPHPLGSATLEELAARAKAALPEIIHLMTPRG